MNSTDLEDLEVLEDDLELTGESCCQEYSRSRIPLPYYSPSLRGQSDGRARYVTNLEVNEVQTFCQKLKNW